jgi:hypothetical protein
MSTGVTHYQLPVSVVILVQQIKLCIRSKLEELFWKVYSTTIPLPTEWLNMFNAKLKKENRNSILFLDNGTCHHR